MTFYDVIMFDLDGTLTDPKDGITKSVQYALSKFGIIEDNLDRLEPFIGPPLKDSFKEMYSLSDSQAEEAINYYREYFSKTGLYENIPYAGIHSLLEDLKIEGKKLIVATSKPTVFAEKILKHFNLYSYFDLVAGSNLDNTRVLKGEVIEYALSQLGNPKKESIVMVGDRRHDTIGARANGIDSIAVAYGYGSMEELENAGPSFIIQSVEDLRELLLPVSSRLLKFKGLAQG